MQTWMITAIFGLLVLAGGWFGYTRARSLMSLLSGIVCGGVLLYAAHLIRQGQRAGLTAATVVSILLALIFSIRLIKTRKFMPAGMMLILSLAELAVLFFRT